MQTSRGLVRLLALLALALGLVGLSPRALLLAALMLLVAVMALGGSELLRVWLQRVSRLRWFFLAIFLLYLLGGMPGAVESGPAWMEAIYRVGILVVLVGAVVICLADLPAAELATGLSRVLSPLQVLGVPVAALSRRLAAALEAVVHMQSRVSELPRQASAASLDRLAEVFLAAEQYRVPQGAAEAVRKRAELQDFAVLALALLVLLGLRWL